MKCNACGAENSEDSRFCAECGAKLEAPAAEMPKAEETVKAEAPQTVNVANNRTDAFVNDKKASKVKEEPKKEKKSKKSKKEEASVPVEGEEGGKKKKKKKHGFLKFLMVLAIIFLLLYSAFVKPAWFKPLKMKLTPLPESYTQGATVNASATQYGSKTGDLEEDGIEIAIAKESFAEGTKVTAKVEASPDGKAISNDKFTALYAPIEFSADGYNGEYLGDDVTVTVIVPEKLREKNCQTFVVACDKGNGEYEYYPIDSYNYYTGAVTFSTPHFSKHTVAKLNKNEAVDMYLDTYCQQAAMRKLETEKMNEILGPDISKALEGMGVPSDQIVDLSSAVVGGILDKAKDGLLKDSLGVANNLGAAVIKYTTAEDKEEASGSYLEALNNVAFEEVTKVLMESKGFDTSVHPYPAKIVAGVISKSGDIVGSIETGDYAQVAGDLLQIGVSLEPSTAIAMASAELLRSCANNLYNSFEATEIDKLYKMYRDGSDEFDSENFNDLWESVDYSWWYGSGRAATRLLKQDTIKKYCEARGWDETDYNRLTDEKKAEINNMARADLEKYFRARLETEKEAEAMKKEEKKFIEGLYGLMDSTAYCAVLGEKDGYDINTRLRSIYEVRSNLSRLVDESKMKHIGEEYSDLVFKFVSDGVDGYTESERYARIINYMNKKGYLRAGIEVPELTEPELSELDGRWTATMVTSNIKSEFLNMLAEALSGLFGDIVIPSEVSNEVVFNIVSFSDNSAQVKLYLEGNEKYLVYDAEYNHGNLKLTYNKEDTPKFSDDDDSDILAEAEIPKRFTLSFSKNQKVISMSGTTHYSSFLGSADLSFSADRITK